MSLDKYLQKRTIKKTIDPSVGETVSALPPIPRDFSVPERVSQTPVDTIIKDLKVQATDVMQTATRVAEEIYNLNKSDKGFLHYHDLVQKSRPDLVAYVYPATVSSNQIKAAERDVFRRLVDPRAPFIRDLFQIADEAQAVLYGLENFWENIVKPNQFTKRFENTKIVKYSLLKEQQYLSMLKKQSGNIQANKLQMVGICLVKGLVRAMVNNTFNRISEVKGQSVDTVLNTLETVRATVLLLQTSQINITQHWETFQTNIGKNFKDIFAYIGQQAANSVAYTFFGGVESKIFEHTAQLNSLIDISALDGSPCLDLVEFKNQVNTALYKNLAKIEEHLLEREYLAQELDENRAAAILTAQKNSRTNQFLHLLNLLINELHQIKIATLRVDVDMETVLTNKIMGSMREYRKLISVGGGSA